MSLNEHHPWHALEAERALEARRSDAKLGLSPKDVESRRAEFGDNTLPEPEPTHPLKRLLSQFADPLVGALLAAALVSLAVALSESNPAHGGLARFGDTLAILLIVVVNAALGFIQEQRAEHALGALRKMVAKSARVLRGGETLSIPASQLVVGDVIKVSAGDSIPADARLLQAHELRLDEAALTGESTPVTKNSMPPLATDTPLAERLNMLYMGTTAVRGRGLALVTESAPHTELGKIGALIQATETPPTPLEERLAKLGKIILGICLAISALLFALGLLQGGRGWSVMLLTAVSLAVAAIPEGLPAITTITLALGMQRMAARGAIIRKLPAVETLGGATVICSDKTGTLTENQMTIRIVETADQVYDVSGEGYATDGRLSWPGGDIQSPSGPLLDLCQVAVICNTASVRWEGEKPTVIGDPTEAALIVLAHKMGAEPEKTRQEFQIESELPFDSSRKRMSVLARDPEGVLRTYVKGSADVLLPRCSRMLTEQGTKLMSEDERARLLERAEAHSKQALRVLALATGTDRGDEDPETDLSFVGFVAMIDPPRPQAKAAVRLCHQAGIRVVMITGDHKLTAIAIARELGIWLRDSNAMTGAELEKTSDEELDQRIEGISVFARVTAEQKLRLVRALKSRGHVVAMTGDGVNDAPALREAQIGVAMGLAGTDVAREAGDMVLADDDFGTVVHAIREGRALFRNIQKFIYFLNSSNAGLVVAVIAGSFFAWMPQLTPLQLLWVNLVTNGLPALALGLDPPAADQMREPPRSLDEGILGLRDLAEMVLVGLLMGGAALGIFWLPTLAPGLIGGADLTDTLARCRAMAFTLLAISPLFHAFNCRSHTESAFARLGSNPLLWGAIATSLAVHLITLFTPSLYPVFHTHALSLTEWVVVVGLAAIPVPVFELIKLRRRAVMAAKNPTLDK